jgi:cytochrome c-type biogenesis protein CcmH/NrfG
VAAGAALGKAIALSPNNADAWFNLGNAERGLCRFDAAAEGGGFAKALKLAPGNPRRP